LAGALLLLLVLAAVTTVAAGASASSGMGPEVTCTFPPTFTAPPRPFFDFVETGRLPIVVTTAAAVVFLVEAATALLNEVPDAADTGVLGSLPCGDCTPLPLLLFKPVGLAGMDPGGELTVEGGGVTGVHGSDDAMPSSLSSIALYCLAASVEYF